MLINIMKRLFFIVVLAFNSLILHASENEILKPAFEAYDAYQLRVYDKDRNDSDLESAIAKANMALVEHFLNFRYGSSGFPRYFGTYAKFYLDFLLKSNLDCDLKNLRSSIANIDLSERFGGEISPEEIKRDYNMFLDSFYSRSGIIERMKNAKLPYHAQTVTSLSKEGLDWVSQAADCYVSIATFKYIIANEKYLIPLYKYVDILMQNPFEEGIKGLSVPDYSNNLMPVLLTYIYYFAEKEYRLKILREYNFEMEENATEARILEALKYAFIFAYLDSFSHRVTDLIPDKPQKLEYFKKIFYDNYDTTLKSFGPQDEFELAASVEWFFNVHEYVVSHKDELISAYEQIDISDRSLQKKDK